MNRFNSTSCAAYCALAVSALITGCGGGGGGNTPAPTTAYTVGGSAAGITATGLVLRNNGGDDLAVNVDGPFTFTTALADGAAYTITVAAQPPGLGCTLDHASGNVAGANVRDVAVECHPLQRLVLSRDAGGTQSDILTIIEDGSGSVALANSSDDESFVGIMPSGRAIYVQSTGGQRDVYSILLDGTGRVALANTPADERAAGNQYAHSITPSGKVVLQSGNDLTIVNDDGTNAIPVAASVKTYHGATIGGRLVFTRTVTSGSPPVSDLEIYSVNEDGTGMVALGSTTAREAFARITSSGRILFSRDTNLFSINADGSDERVLSTSSANQIVLTVTPGNRIIFTRDDGNYDLFSVSETGTGLCTIAGSSDVEMLVTVGEDDTVYYSRVVGGTQTDVYAIQSDCSNPRTLGATSNYESFGGFTGDGRLLLLRQDGSQWDIYVVNSDGTGEIRLTNSPESEYINQCQGEFCPVRLGRFVFSRIAAGQSQGDLYSMMLDGSGLAVLANSADNEEPLHVTADRLIFRRYSSSQVDIYSVRLDGTDLRALADTPDQETLHAVVAP